MNHSEGYALTQNEDTGEIKFRITAKTDYRRTARHRRCGPRQAGCRETEGVYSATEIFLEEIGDGSCRTPIAAATGSDRRRE